MLINLSQAEKLTNKMACSTSFLTSLLENYWPEMNMALSKINPISVSSKRILYKPGDPLTHIYLLLHGYMFLSIAHEQLKLSPGQLVGEYQAQIGSTSRMTMLLVGKGAQFLQLPFSYYQSINQNYHHNNMFLNDVVGGLDRKLKYVVSKMFTLKKIKRDEELVLEASPRNHIGVIKSGRFKIKKAIGLGVIKKYKVQLQKQFSILQLGPGEIVRENVWCDSAQGEAFVCLAQDYETLSEKFRQLEGIFQIGKEKQASRIQRQKSIKNICIQRKTLMNSILPSVFQKSNSNSPKKQGSKLKKKKSYRYSTEESFDKNHFFIKINKDKRVQTGPTNLNLSLIPIVKIRKFNIPSKIQPMSIRSINLQCMTKRSEIKQDDKSESKKQPTTEADFEIPEIFNSKFKRKMFLKANNPFHHFKSKSVSFDEHLVENQINRIESERSNISIKKTTKKLLSISYHHQAP